MANLNRRNKKQCQVIMALLVTSLLLQQGDKEVGDEGKDNPAVQNCIAMIDEIFATHAHDQPTIDAMHARINAHRLRLMKKVSKFETVDGLIGALQLLSSGFIVSRPGTRLDYILQIFKENLPKMKRLLPYTPARADEFEELLKKTIIKVG